MVWSERLGAYNSLVKELEIEDHLCLSSILGLGRTDHSEAHHSLEEAYQEGLAITMRFMATDR